MSLSVDKAPVDVTGERIHTSTRSVTTYVTVVLMLVYSALAFGRPTEPAYGPSIWLVALMIYFVVIYLYYGIARLAFEKRTVLLWV
ncbi:MAG: hypothetical protein U9R56_00125, partial [candidate division Zixibacteria bacterium]|nr:hypothetical protein [candidate division Zixibacteria bacterium]